MNSFNDLQQAQRDYGMQINSNGLPSTEIPIGALQGALFELWKSLFRLFREIAILFRVHFKILGIGDCGISL
jgi:hypothetical protein